MVSRVRARDFGVVLGDMEAGKLNAITDVEGVGVGHSTIISGDDVRTGVTAIIPHQGNPYEEKVTAAVDLFNAWGKATGLPQIMFEGVIEVPIMLTETLNTWRVADATLDYMNEGYGVKAGSLNVVVGETNGGYLTDNLGRHVGRDAVFEALDAARSPEGVGHVPEGNVGGGTPMSGYGFKGGIGTSSRVYGNFTVGVLVQLNCGRKDDLMIGGVPVGREAELPGVHGEVRRDYNHYGVARAPAWRPRKLHLAPHGHAAYHEVVFPAAVELDQDTDGEVSEDP